MRHLVPCTRYLELKLRKVMALALLFSSQEAFAQCFESAIQSPSPFMGNDGEIFKLIDGSLWKVMYEYEYLYEYQPSVVVCPGESVMVINGKKLDIAPIGNSQGAEGSSSGSGYFESRIDGEFNGFDGDTIIPLVNGQVWQQSDYAYHYRYSYSPKVIVFQKNGRYQMQVEGIDESVGVTRLK